MVQMDSTQAAFRSFQRSRRPRLSEDELQMRSEKVQIAERLRAQITMSLQEIASRLSMGYARGEKVTILRADLFQNFTR
jgi:hypothetical protein